MGQSSSWKVGIAVAVVAVVIGGWFGSTQRAQPPDRTTPVAAWSPSSDPHIQVHVAGWVASPGVVSLPEGSLTADAVAAAGGLRPGARADAINLAAPVADGLQLVVPGPDGAPAEPGAGTGSSSGGLVAVNRATVAELEALPGVGPVLAGRIVAYRDQNGPFSLIEDLLGVPGIGEAKLAALRDLITVP